MQEIMKELSDIKRSQVSVPERGDSTRVMLEQMELREEQREAEQRVKDMEKHLADLTNRRLDYLEVMHQRQVDVQVCLK